MDDCKSLWEEELDVDDSDLSLVFRRCKRRHDQIIFESQSVISVSSQHSQTLVSPPSPPQPSFRLIPGPAGAVQAAMFRKARDTRDLAPGESAMSTQDYIRKAVEAAEEDDDFKGNPWNSAISFLRAEGGEGNLIHATPLSEVMNCSKSGKIDKVVAIIKSCTPNGLGDFLLNLKDQTGTFGAIIHGKIFSESEFVKDISVGAVLIIQNVSVFSPTKTSHHIVITLRNISKVFSKETCPQLSQNSGACAVEYAPPEFREKPMNVEKFVSREPRRTDGIMNEIMRKNGKEMNASTTNQNEMGRPVLVELSEHQMASHKFPSRSSNEQTKCSAAEDVEKKSQPLITKASVLSKWTDDQLSQLFDMECDDDGSLF